MKLPFLDPEEDIYINLFVILILIHVLQKTSRGTLKLNNERLHIFLYLLKNPTILNKALSILGKDGVTLHDRDSYSIMSLYQNIDPLFNRKALKSLLGILISKKMIFVEYKKDNGFFYVIEEKGNSAVQKINEEYFQEINEFCGKLKPLLTYSEAQLNSTINQILKTEAV